MVEFKINRKQCIENKIVKNSGKSSGFEDFRSKKKKLNRLNYFIENFFLRKYF
jgi:hypothetical protein